MSARALLVRMWAITFVATTSSACEALLTDPAPATPDVDVSFTLEGEAAGGMAEAFDRVDRVYLVFTRADSAQRDTVIRVTNEDGVARVRLKLDTKERIPALGVYAELRVNTAALFKGSSVIRVQLGETTSAEIALSPIGAFVQPDRQLLTLQSVGDTIRLSSAVLFASRDTIPGLSGMWAAEDASIIAVTPAGLTLARHVGQTRLLLRYGTLTDTINARVLRERVPDRAAASR